MMYANLIKLGQLPDLERIRRRFGLTDAQLARAREVYDAALAARRDTDDDAAASMPDA
jgi:hypothetical protein